MGGDYDYDANGGVMTMMMNEEEAPSFREGRHPSSADSAKPMTTAAILSSTIKPASSSQPTPPLLSRGDSSSSTATTGSTYNNSHKEEEDEQQQAQHQHQQYGEELSVRLKERGSDGDWLQQLQYRLYSREEEEAILMQTYSNNRRPSLIRRNSNSPSGDFCLISGAAGIGKTRLARTLEAPVLGDGGYFLSAKFDQVKQARPTRIFADAFTEFTHAILAQAPEVVEATRQNIRDALGDELAVLLSGIPVLERIVGPPPSGQVVQMTCQMSKRFVFALQDLVNAVCSHETPMVLLFDDLQWADRCSLKLLKAFISCNQNKHLFIMGTCDDSVGPCSPVSGMLRELEDEGNRQIFNIKISQKPCKVVRQVITEALPMPVERHDALAKLVCGQTQGNPLYVLEFLRWLSDERLLQYDAADGTWTLHDNDARLRIDSCRLGDFLVNTLEKLPDDLKEIIRVAACFGNDINEDMMKTVFPGDGVCDLLHEATSRGVFVYDNDSGYSFRHDGLQRAALSLIPPEEKDSLHLRLGRLLLNGLTESEREKHIYLILGQLRLGKDLMKEAQEREHVAFLCLTAGQATARASAFGAAAGYFDLGIELLDDSWSGDYSLKLALYNAAAEMHLTVSNYERVHELLQEVFDNVPKLSHKIQAYSTLIYTYGVTDQQHLAVDTGVKVLVKLNEHFPIKNCMQMLRAEMCRVKRLLAGKSNAQILRMEIIRNEEKVAALQLLNIMFLNALLVKPKFAPFIQLKSVVITMEHGLSAMSSVAFASYGMLCAAMGQYDDASRFGQLALDLLKKFRSKEYAPRVFASVYGCITPFQRPIRETLEPLKKAQLIGSQTGDIEFACLNANLYSSALFFSNATLPAVSNQIEGIINMMSTRRQDSMLVLIKPFYQLTHNLMGLAEDPLTLSGDIVELDNASRHAEETRNATSLVCIRLQKMMLFYLFEDYEGAGKVVQEIEAISFPAPGIEHFFGRFFIGMTHLATARIYKGFQRRKCLNKAKKVIKQFKTWSLHSPHNCLPMKFLLEAELASFQGKNKKAYEKYTAATAMAVDAGFRMIEAMTHEHSGRHLYAIGDEALAAVSYRKALKCYEEWGAKAKVHHLQQQVHDMFRMSSVDWNS